MRIKQQDNEYDFHFTTSLINKETDITKIVDETMQRIYKIESSQNGNIA